MALIRPQRFSVDSGGEEPASYITPEAGLLIKDQLTGVIKGTVLLEVTRNWELMLEAVRNIVPAELLPQQ